MLGGIGVQEMLLIFLVVLLLFGAKRIPEIAHGLGKGIREFRNAVQETKDEMNRAMEIPDPKSTAKPAPPTAETTNKPPDDDAAPSH
jgi:sec-independent protein translocase protein TatA